MRLSEDSNNVKNQWSVFTVSGLMNTQTGKKLRYKLKDTFLFDKERNWIMPVNFFLQNQDNPLVFQDIKVTSGQVQKKKWCTIEE